MTQSNAQARANRERKAARLGWPHRKNAGGVIASFTDGVSRHFPGKDGVREAIDYADAHGLKVLVFSTPESILRDLQGDRARPQADVGTKYPKDGDVLPFVSPEERTLRQMQRLDVWQRPTVRTRWWPLRLLGKGRAK